MTAFVLFSASIGGTERRIATLYRALEERYPGKYHIILNKELYNSLQKINYNLKGNVHIVKDKSVLDRKSRAEQGFFTQIGRLFTLLRYRKHIKKIVKKHNIKTIQVYLEMVRVLGFFPIKNVRSIASIVSSLPKYYDKRNINCKILIHALKNFSKIDMLYENKIKDLIKLGVNKRKINCPGNNFVNHTTFTPKKKEKTVTFSARMFDYKNPLLLLEAIQKTIPHVDQDIRFYLMGRGSLLKKVRSKIKSDRIKAGFVRDPSTLVNKSSIHVSVQSFENSTSQSMLEGMAAGCAIIASDVGMTSKVITPDVGILVNLSSDELSDALILLLNNPKKTKKLGSNARKKILKEHNINDYADYIVKL